MRILMLTDFYRPLIGGQERHVENLACELAERGRQVAVATLWHEGLEPFEEDRGVRIYRIRGTVQRAAGLFSQAGRRFAPPAPDPETVWALRRIIKRERPQIVHAHSWIVHSFLPLKTWSGAKLVVTLHDYGLRCATKTLMRHERPCGGPALDRCPGCAATHYGPLKAGATLAAQRATLPWLVAAVDRFIAVSQAVAEGNGLAGGGRACEVIPNFIADHIEAPEEDVADHAAQLPSGDFLLFVGALSRHKGVRVLLDAYTRLEDAPPLALIGIWADPELHLPAGTRVFQHWPHAAVMRAWQRCIIGIVPSIWPEPCPTVAMEAMLAGRPLVASRIGGLPDLVAHEETGLLAPPGDAGALAAALAHLLGDPALRRRMGAAGQRRVAAFQARAVIPRIEALYAELLEPASQTIPIR